MGCLQPAEIELIAAMYARDPRCPARRFAAKILAGPGAEDLLDIELFLLRAAEACTEIWALQRLDEDYRIRRREADRRQRDPTR